MFGSVYYNRIQKTSVLNFFDIKALSSLSTIAIVSHHNCKYLQIIVYFLTTMPSQALWNIAPVSF